MIDSVRNTVLSVLNKNNYGYISPSDFNLFAKQAQLDIFGGYIYEYNYQINKENARQSGTEYADIKKGLEEVIDYFSVSNHLSHSANNKFSLPSQITTGDDYFLINKVLCFPTTLSSGSNTSVVANQLVDSGAAFVTNGVARYDIVSNIDTEETTRVVSVTATALVLEDNIFTSTPSVYAVYDESSMVEAEKVTNSKISLLDSSNLTKPSTKFPAYTTEGLNLVAYPRLISKYGAVLAQYIRYPRDPKWTWVTLSGGEPSFDQSNSLYQDFELSIDDGVELIVKILKYAGLSIRESDVVSTMANQEIMSNQEEK
jgi:hypothetical protein